MKTSSVEIDGVPAGASVAASLRFDADFESGNLAEALLVSEAPLEFDLHIRHDTENERHRVWWFFTARASRSGTRALLNIVGYSKTKSLYRDGMSPLVHCSTTTSAWERMPAGQAYFYRSPRHGPPANTRTREPWEGIRLGAG
jgi:hypothetical protein